MAHEDLDYLGAIRDNATALVDAAEAAGLDAPVPSCPKWNVADLLEHIGFVHRWAAANLERAPDDPYMASRDMGFAAPERREAAAWVRDGAVALVDALGAKPPETAAWTWLPPATNEFWRRRQAHETAVHRVDAQLAAGSSEPIDGSLAADGVDEWLSMVPNLPWVEEKITGNGETIHLHCTDVDGEWLIRLEPEGMQLEREHAKGDVAARGSASNVQLWLMDRIPLDRLEVFGDAALLESWRDRVKF
jgi:uncharacterized protein (TIGR03083 family)